MGGWPEAGSAGDRTRGFPRYPQSVQITVSILGGMMDDDRVTSVRGDQLIVKDHGKIRVDRRLAPSDVDQLERLANEVAGVTMSKRAHPYAVDGGITTIEIAGDKSEADRAVGRRGCARTGMGAPQCNRRAGSGRRVVAVLIVSGEPGGRPKAGRRSVRGNLILYPQRDSNTALPP